VRVWCRACLEEPNEALLDVDAAGVKSKVRGGEPVDDVGDGGPREAVDTNVCGDESGERGNGGEDKA
jgi:hypothetical protein